MLIEPDELNVRPFSCSRHGFVSQHLSAMLILDTCSGSWQVFHDTRKEILRVPASVINYHPRVYNINHWDSIDESLKKSHKGRDKIDPTFNLLI